MNGNRSSTCSTRLRLAAVCVAAAALCHQAAGAEEPSPARRIALDARAEYFALDSDYFGLSDGFGAGAALRYELAPDIYFENSVGFFGADQSGVSVGGFDYGLSLVALFNVLVPYRPLARAGIGFISVDPVTVTPTGTFRPSQTAFYFVGGVGVSRAIFGRARVEANANVWITPYRYRIYTFDRYEVTTEEERFSHVSISLGAGWTF